MRPLRGPQLLSSLSYMDWTNLGFLLAGFFHCILVLTTKQFCTAQNLSVVSIGLIMIIQHILKFLGDQQGRYKDPVQTFQRHVLSVSTYCQGFKESSAIGCPIFICVVICASCNTRLGIGLGIGFTIPKPIPGYRFYYFIAVL